MCIRAEKARLSIQKYRKGYVILSISVFILFGILTTLFYRQAIQYNGMYRSDLPIHIRFAVEGDGYSILYFLMGVIFDLTKSVFFIALLESLMIIITWLFTARLIQYMIRGISHVKACIFGLPIVFLTGIYIPVIYERFYKQQLITQPYHNITYYGMRLFAVCVMIIFVKLFDTYLERIKWSDWCLLSLSLVLATMIKPNFFCSFVQCRSLEKI